MPPFISSLTKKSYLGVDIGTTSIKIVEIEQGGKTPKLNNYAILEKNGYLERVNDIIQSSSLKISEKETIDLLKEIVSQAKFKTREAIVSLPAYSAFTTLLEIPQMSEGDIAKAMQFQISQHIPLPISEVTIDWIKVGETNSAGNGGKQLVFLISVPNEQILRYQNIFSSAGLKLRALEVESLSLIRSLTGNDNTRTLIIDIGTYSTGIFIAEGGYLKHSAQTDFAGISLTKAVASGLGLELRRAEELKKQKGIVSGGDYELSTLISPFLDAILNEAMRARNNYESVQRGNIERIILSGGTAGMAGIKEYVERAFRLPVVVGNPFLGLDSPPDIAPIINDLGPRMAVAIGLASRKF